MIGIGLAIVSLERGISVSASHQLALITSLPFVHTARRYYRLNGLVRSLDRPCRGWQWPRRRVEKTIKLDHLEEVKVVTRFQVNLRKDHYRSGRKTAQDKPG